MGKWLFLVLLAIIIYLFVKQTKRKDSARANATRMPEDMVACARCGVNLPKSEAHRIQGSFFCCKDHSGPEAGGR